MSLIPELDPFTSPVSTREVVSFGSGTKKNRKIEVQPKEGILTTKTDHEGEKKKSPLKLTMEHLMKKKPEAVPGFWGNFPPIK